MGKYKFLEHTSDIKFQAEGKTIEEAFENAAYALAETMTKGVKVNAKINWKIDAGGKDCIISLRSFFFCLMLKIFYYQK